MDDHLPAPPAANNPGNVPAAADTLLLNNVFGRVMELVIPRDKDWPMLMTAFCLSIVLA